MALNERTQHYVVFIDSWSKSHGDRIHVFLQALLEDLKDLFQTGLYTYDVSRDESFTL
jgi:hypothetical protein